MMQLTGVLGSYAMGPVTLDLAQMTICVLRHWNMLFITTRCLYGIVRRVLAYYPWRHWNVHYGGRLGMALWSIHSFLVWRILDCLM